MSELDMKTCCILVGIILLLAAVVYVCCRTKSGEKFTTSYARANNVYPYSGRPTVRHVGNTVRHVGNANRTGGKEKFKGDYTTTETISNPVTDHPMPAWVGFSKTTQNPFVGEITGTFGLNPKQGVADIWKSVDGI